MRLSEAIRLGSLTFGELVAGGGAGRCALNCGLTAVGRRGDWQSAGEEWPWLAEMCGTPLPPYYPAPFVMQVAWLFDGYVMKGKMTIEALCDQVRAWEDELAAKGVNVEQVSLAAELNQSASQAAEHTEKELVVEAK